MSARFLLFGGAGFLGARLQLQLQSMGLAVKTARTDLRDRAAVRAVLKELKPTHVVNAAARGVDPTNPVDLDTMMAVNARGPLALQEECEAAGVQSFIHLGSCFEYGSNERPIEEDFPLHPIIPYARSKAQASMALLDRASRFRCATVVLRLFGVWGPGEKPHRLVPQIVNAARTGVPVKLTHGRQIRDFSFVDDMSRDIALLSQSDSLRAGDVVNVGSGVGLSVIDFAKSVASALGTENLLQVGALPTREGEREGEMNKLVCSTKKLSSLIRPTPRTSLADGLKLMR